MSDGRRQQSCEDPDESRLDTMRRLLRASFCQAARQLRAERRNMTQRRLSVRMGRSRETIIAVEGSRTALTEEHLARLLVALDLAPVDFLAAVAWHLAASDVRLAALLGRLRERQPVSASLGIERGEVAP